jgi:hypothetical protein
MQAGNLKIYPSAQALIELTMLKTLPVLLRYKLVRVENVAHIPTRLPHVPVRAGCAGIRRSTVSPLRLFCQVIPCHMQWFLFRPGAASGPATARKRGDIKRRQFHLLLVQGRPSSIWSNRKSKRVRITFRTPRCPSAGIGIWAICRTRFSARSRRGRYRYDPLRLWQKRCRAASGEAPSRSVRDVGS